MIWGISLPDAPQSNDLQHAITLTPAEPGTQLRPAMRYFVRMQAAEFTRSISRHFR